MPPKRKNNGRGNSGAKGGKSKKSRTKNPTTATPPVSEEDSQHHGPEDLANEPISPQQQPEPSAENSSVQDSEGEIEFHGLTVDNYSEQLEKWTLSQLRAALKHRERKTKNRMSNEVSQELHHLKLNYTKMKLMLALIDNVSEKCVNDNLGEGRVPRKQTGYNRYLKYTVTNRNDAMPRKGTSEGLAERNKQHGEGWSSLNEDEKLVFSDLYFFILANVKRPVEDEEDESDDVVDEDKLEQLKPIYERLVDHEKVVEDFGDGQGDKSKSQSKKALKMINNVASDLKTFGNIFNATYYMLASTRHSKDGCFIYESSNLSGWRIHANKQWDLKSHFEIYSQGKDIHDEVSRASNTRLGRSGALSADELKSKLRKELNDLLASVLREEDKEVKVTFHKGPNPIASLSKQYPYIKCIVDRSASLSKPDLKIGFEKMNAQHRRRWFHDIKNGHFKLERTDEDQDEDEEIYEIEEDDIEVPSDDE